MRRDATRQGVCRNGRFWRWRFWRPGGDLGRHVSPGLDMVMASVIPSCREYNDIPSIVVITLGQCFLTFISRFWGVCTVIVIVLVDCVLYIYRSWSYLLRPHFLPSFFVYLCCSWCICPEHVSPFCPTLTLYSQSVCGLLQTPPSLFYSNLNSPFLLFQRNSTW
jgi:hypothetical protein